MPAKSQSQAKYIFAMRNKYGTKKKAPKNMKWVFDEEWTSGVKVGKLPNKVKESRLFGYDSFINESETKSNNDPEDESCGCLICRCVSNCTCDCCCSVIEDEEEEGDVIKFVPRKSYTKID